MEIKKGRYVSFIVFVGGDAHRRDWLACVWRDAEGPWRGEYRFRYYADGAGDPWDGRDEKSGYDLVLDASLTEEAIRKQFCFVAEQLVARGFNNELNWLDIGTDDPEVIFQRLKTRAWAHMKVAELCP